ncbi:hypothetical protein GCM10022226_77400 [Sphaerisporangium flaviroseum]|uniref:DUF4352 domain-containing protein n=1 Tax=Sphaerisporangium flaviroseum TaxID=509199 RepID=A0ABP7JEJ2_9ACTN
MTGPLVAERPIGAPPAEGARRGRFSHALGNGVVALAIGAAAVYAHTFAMDKDKLDAPLTSHAAAGGVAVTGRFSARLEKVVAARSLRLLTTSTDPETGRVTIKKSGRVGTQDVFIVVTIGATSPGDPTRLDDAWLRTADGVEYAATDRVGPAFTLPHRPVQNGWWVDVVFVFEIPPEALAGASIVVSAPSSNGIYDTIYPNRYNQLLPEAELPISADRAAARRLLDDVKTSWQLAAEE